MFVDRFSRNIQLSDSMKMSPVGADLLHVDGQEDMTKLIFAFRNFANKPKNNIEHVYIFFFY
jgi:hypothetical protein